MSTLKQQPLKNSRAICYIGLGSNLAYKEQAPKELLKSALVALGTKKQITLTQHSSIYISQAHGPQDQDKYHNAVAEIHTTLSATELLTALHTIESEHGLERSKKRHWGERSLDLDILLYGQEQYSLPDLHIPHPFLEQREFVIFPLFEINPTLRLPNGKELKSLAEICPENGIIKLNEK